MENLSSAFMRKMEILLGEDFQKFLESCACPPFRAVRVNTLKCGVGEFSRIAPFSLKPTPFCPEGFYVEADGLGRHPYHHAGVYYVQEPSAMSAVAALDPQPGERILDLCAAPGGKSTQIAARLGGIGLLVANEFVSSRAGILLSNIERMGVANAVVLNLRPDALCDRMRGWFDRVLVDAPCSGEGMFRKDPRAVNEWSPEHSISCAARQRSILESAKEAVRPGGALVYSTCTFSIEENEAVVCGFLKDNPDFSLEEIPCAFGSASRPEWLDAPFDLAKMRRIFPFQGGEGHFVARLRRAGGERLNDAPAGERARLPLFEAFWEELFEEPLPGRIALVRDAVYLLPAGLPPLAGLRTLRAGVLAGHLVKNRFVPAHQLALSGHTVRKERLLNLACGDPRLLSYLRGEELLCPGPAGWRVVSVDGFALGWGKASAGRLKNHYPKGLRERR